MQPKAMVRPKAKFRLKAKLLPKAVIRPKANNGKLFLLIALMMASFIFQDSGNGQILHHEGV